ncbi:MAG: bifunctional 5,10-methylenetetrahydrofolate dehydrogenase/5,10-methenyltetrahydrofolate cyclohydrolase [Vampirovibrionales bacterium]
MTISDVEQSHALRLDGKHVSKAILAEVGQGLATCWKGQPPKLVVLLVGNDPASEVYVSHKMKASQKLGMTSETRRLPATISEHELLDRLDSLNHDPDVHAILVQLPLPGHINSQRVLEAIDPRKDVDGFHPLNMGQLLTGIEPVALPCTPAGMVRLLDYYDLSVAGKHAVVVGRSNIVGKPISLMLLHRHATVTICHSRTPDLPHLLSQADVVVAAIGRPNYVQADWVKPGAVVLDVGINRMEDGSLCGDVEKAVVHRASAVTPVPGGVGPMTIAMLMVNTMRLAQAQQGQTVKPWLMT